jgi:succinoglycan biosynthesis transport protein ExoP
VLLDQADVRDAIQFLGSNMPAVLTSGQLPPNPSELLGSRRMGELLAELRSAYEIVLVDCAPLLPVTDPMVVSRFADGVLLVARAGTTTRDHAQAAQVSCEKAGAKIFGGILNATAVTEGNQPAYYAYYGEGDRQHVSVEMDLNLSAGNGNGAQRAENGRAARHRRIRSESR